MFAVFTGCSEDPSSVGSAFFPPNVKLDSLVVYADSTTTYRAPIPGNSSVLMLGRYQNYEARMLLQFGTIFLPSGVTSSNIVSASIKLIPSYWFKDSTGLLEFTVHPITRSWSSTTFTFDSTNSAFDPIAVGLISKMMTTSHDTLVDSISTTLVRTWVDSSQLNYGILLKPTLSCNVCNVVYGFSSILTLLEDTRPLLTVRYRVPDSTTVDSVVVATQQDMFVAYAPEVSPSSQTFIVQAGVADRGLLHFDVSNIPRSASITRADLQIVRIPLQSIRNQLSYDSVFVQYIVENSSSPKGSTSLLAQPVAEGDSVFKADITRFVQPWVTGAPNYGIAVRAYGEFIALDRFAFYGKADTLNRPTLRITYSLVQQQ